MSKQIYGIAINAKSRNVTIYNFTRIWAVI